MFGLGMPEILLILAIALIVIGPKKLPDLAKTLGRAMGEFKRSAQDFKNSIDVETTLKDIETPAADLKNIIKDVNKGKETIVEPGDIPDMAESENQDINTDETPDNPSDKSNREPLTSSDEPDSPAPKDPENKTEPL
ncbi:MAG: preprotein translocase subunit TatB [Deltaproteobacteria bacterium]|nr:MAG: preprotein translocase subunit TatB [Deltaproteobacteria bacterium]